MRSCKPLFGVLFLATVATCPVIAAERVCSDPAVIFCDDFETGFFAQWDDGYLPALHAITSDPEKAYTGQRALEVTYPEGIRPTGTDFFFASLVMLNWQRHPDPGEVMFYSYFPDMKAAPDGMFWGNFSFQREPREAIAAGLWYCLELEVKANQPGRRDGYQRMWINDQFKGEVTDMRWRDTSDLRINTVQLAFSASPVPITEHVWIDNVVVSTEHIGCNISP